MKYLIISSRIFVGVIFILSGLIKLNDPLGFSFKLEEYFSTAVFNMPLLASLALGLAFVVVILEILLGVCLLIGFQIKWTLRILILMLIFFGFLTFYSAYYNKVTDCGCFGDAIKFTPWQSFLKDLLLFVLSLFVVIGKNFVKALFPKKINGTIVLTVFLACILFGTYVLWHLPVVDFRPYKIGTNISESMKIPENAPKDIFEYTWQFNQSGKDIFIKNQGDYPEVEGDFVDVKTLLLSKGYEPPIHDFTMKNGDTDYTEMLMKIPKLLIITSYDISSSSPKAWEKLPELISRAQQKNYTLILLSASSEAQDSVLKEKCGIDLDIYHADNTTIKTIIRSNPGAFILQKGTIMQKRHYNDFSLLKFD